MMSVFSYLAMAAITALAQDPAASSSGRNARRLVGERPERIHFQAVEPTGQPHPVQHAGAAPSFFTPHPAAYANASQEDGKNVVEWIAPARWTRLQAGSANLTLAPLGRESDNLGATLAPVDPTLRQQLQLPEHQGVIVTSVAPGGPAERVKIEANDILLSLEYVDSAQGEDLTETLPIEEPGDLIKHAKAVGEKPVVLKLMRKGEPITLKVKPRYRVTLAPIEDEAPRYFIGVQANPVDDTLRGHLKLPENAGLVVNEVIAGSPSEAGGVKSGDILIDIAGKPLTSTDVLITTVQENGEKPLDIKAIRQGGEIVLNVVPSPRPASDDEEQMTAEVVYDLLVPSTTAGGRAPDRFFEYYKPNPTSNEALSFQAYVRDHRYSQMQPAQAAPSGDSADSQIATLTRQVEELKQAVEALKQAVEAKE